MLSLVLEVVAYGLTTWNAGVMKDPLQIVRTLDGGTTTVDTLKMHQFSVRVSILFNHILIHVQLYKGLENY